MYCSTNLSDVSSDIRGPLYIEAMAMQSRGVDILKLNTGNPATFGYTMPDSIRSALVANIDQAVGYCDFRGMDDARQAIYDYHRSRGISNFTMDDIFLGNGVSELASMCMSVLLSAGDEVLAPSPCYTLWSNAARIAGGKPVLYICDEDSLWYPDIADLESKITPKTKAIVVINPNNPTGAVYPDEILLKIIDIARAHNLLIFSDEIYDRLLFDGATHTSTAALAGDMPVVTLNGLSKSHCICGFRCGWAVFSGDAEKLADFKAGMVKLSTLRLCGGALTQLVIPAALRDVQFTKALVSPGGGLYESRRAALGALKSCDSISVVDNKGAFYLFPKIKSPSFEDKDFAAELLRRKHILIVPGSGFEHHDRRHFRLVMLPEPAELKKAIEDILDLCE